MPNGDHLYPYRRIYDKDELENEILSIKSYSDIAALQIQMDSISTKILYYRGLFNVAQNRMRQLKEYKKKLDDEYGAK